MFIDRMINQGAAPVIEQVLKFTTARQAMLADDVANIDTLNFKQKDLSPAKFQAMLRERIASAEDGPRGEDFGDITGEVSGEMGSAKGGILFHDGNNRSVEQLMTAGMKNALTHNLMIELLKRQFATMELALQQK